MSVSYFIPDLAPEDLHRCEEIVRRSQFIVSLAHTPTPEAAKSFIERIKQEFPDATHNCWAYAAGAPGQTSKVGYSDDGEPQGTAGMPVLSVLKGEDVKDTEIGVMRYFGGTLLGTGGLVRAYGHSAKEGLLAAGIAELVLYRKYSVLAAYPDSGKVQYEILQDGHELFDTIYTEQVEFIVLVETDAADSFEKKMTEIFRGAHPFTLLEEVYGVWQEGKLSLQSND